MAIQIKKLGLVVDGQVSQADLQQTLATVITHKNALTWQLADLCKLYVDASDDIAAISHWLAGILHLAPTTVQRYALVARRIPINWRTTEHSFTTYMLTAEKAATTITKQNLKKMLEDVEAEVRASNAENRDNAKKHVILTGDSAPCSPNSRKLGTAPYTDMLNKVPFERVCSNIEAAATIFSNRKRSKKDYSPDLMKRLKKTYDDLYQVYTELVAEQCTRQLYSEQ